MIKPTGSGIITTGSAYRTAGKPCVFEAEDQDLVQITGGDEPGSELSAARSIVKKQDPERKTFSIKSIAKKCLSATARAAAAITGIPAAVGRAISGIFTGKPTAPVIPPGSDLIMYPKVENPTILSGEVQAKLDTTTHSRAVEGNSVSILQNGVEAYPKRYKMIEEAKYSVNFQTHLIHSDETGWKVTNLLAKKASEGVKVRFITDWILTRKSDQKMFDVMRKAGVQVVIHNRPQDQSLPADSLENKGKYIKQAFKSFAKGIKPSDLKNLPKWIAGRGDAELEKWKERNKELVGMLSGYNNLLKYRWHMKIMTVDGQKAIIGGLNVGSEYAYAGSGKVDQSQPEDSNSRRSCRDTDMVVEGPMVAEINRTFAENWEYSGGEDPASITGENPPSQKAGNITTRFVTHQPFEKKDADIEDWYCQMLDNVQKTAYFTNAYFVPSDKFKKAAASAAKRGVDVRVFTNSKETNNRPDAFYGGRRHYPEMLKAGVRIYEMTPNNFTTLHAKSAVFDGEVSTAGSSNLDPRSLYRHNEDNLVVHDKKLALEMHRDFKADLEDSNEVTMDDINRETTMDKLKQWYYSKILKHF